MMRNEHYMKDTEIINQIMDEIVEDWGINDQLIGYMLMDMFPAPIRDIGALVSGRVQPTASDICDLLTMRETLRRTYALKSGSRLSRQAV